MFFFTKFLLYFSFLISKTFLLSNFDNNICLNLYKSSQDEKSLINLLEQNSEILISKERNTKKSNSCIALLIYTGNYKALEFYLNLLLKNGVQYRDTLNLFISSLKSKLIHIESRYKFSENDYKKIVPVMKWAQNMDQIYILVKFSSSFEKKGCFELNNLDYKFNEDKLFLKANCILNENPIKFLIDMKLWNEIIPENCSFELNSDGTGTFIMNKKDNKTIWENLYKDGENFDVKIWYEIKQKFIDQLKEYGYVEKNKKEYEEWEKKNKEIEREKKEKLKEKMEYRKKIKEEKGKIHNHNHNHNHEHHHHNDENKNSVNQNILNKITSDL